MRTYECLLKNGVGKLLSVRVFDAVGDVSAHEISHALLKDQGAAGYELWSEGKRLQKFARADEKPVEK